MPGSPFLFQHRPFRDMPRFQAKLQDRNGSTITTIPQSTSTKVPFNDLPKYPLLLHYRPSRDMPGPVIISKTSLGIESYKDALDIQREGLLMTFPGPHCFSNIGLSGKCSGPKPTLQTTSAWLLHYSPLDFLKRPFNDLPRSPMLPQYGIFGDINKSQSYNAHPYSTNFAKYLHQALLFRHPLNSGKYKYLLEFQKLLLMTCPRHHYFSNIGILAKCPGPNIAQMQNHHETEFPFITRSIYRRPTSRHNCQTSIR